MSTSMTGERRTIPQAAANLTKRLGFKVTADDIRYAMKAGYWAAPEFFAGRYVLFDEDEDALAKVMLEHNRDAKKSNRAPRFLRSTDRKGPATPESSNP